MVDRVTGVAAPSRAALRRQLQADRARFVEGAGFATAHQSLARHLSAVLSQLAPSELGLYWSLPGEFNAAAACLADADLDRVALALPFARRTPKSMEYRLWDRRDPAEADECGIPTSTGQACVPEIVVVPCVGFTREGYRLGYGGGYFDRWLAAHPHVTAVGAGWSIGEVGVDRFAPQAHDLPLMMVVTEAGVVGG